MLKKNLSIIVVILVALVLIIVVVWMFDLRIKALGKEIDSNVTTNNVSVNKY